MFRIGSLLLLVLSAFSTTGTTFAEEPSVPLTKRAAHGAANKAGTASAGPLRLPQVFGDHMVLQAAHDVPVWGTAAPNKTVSVSLGKDNQVTRSDESGKWRVRFPPRKAGREPVKLRVACGDEAISLSDILVGEVWLCAGQSNMEFQLARSRSGRDELKTADCPQIRLLNLVGAARGSSGSYTAAHLSRLTPDKFTTGQWKVANAETARTFSAVGWHFGRTLSEELHVPIGLINPAIGGTPTEAWIRRDALASRPEVKHIVTGDWLENERLGEFCRTRGLQNLQRAIQAGEHIPGDDLGANHSFKPGFMWEAGIRPLIPCAIRGVIWYQGESNAETPERVAEHNLLFPLLVNDWRQKWKQGDFPFLFVQLPAMGREHWPAFRDGQRRFLNELDNVGMAITIDTGHPTNVHPVDKRPVGERLAEWALGTTYAKQRFSVVSGPLFRKAEQHGTSLIIHFDHVGSALQTSDGQPPRHFELAGMDGVFHPATARLEGQTIVLSSSKVSEPRHARYGWMPYPKPPVNLLNSAKLPASPFTTLHGVLDKQ